MYEKVQVPLACSAVWAWAWAGREKGRHNFASQVALQKSPSEMGEKARGARRCPPAGPRQAGQAE